jgi:hypothetical protein
MSVRSGAGLAAVVALGGCVVGPRIQDGAFTVEGLLGVPSGSSQRGSPAEGEAEVPGAVATALPVGGGSSISGSGGQSPASGGSAGQDATPTPAPTTQDPVAPTTAVRSVYQAFDTLFPSYQYGRATRWQSSEGGGQDVATAAEMKAKIAAVASANPGGFGVSGTEFAASQTSGKVGCPYSVTHGGKIKTSGGTGKVLYQIVRSDGAEGYLYEAASAAEVAVQSSWLLDPLSSGQTRWEQIRVLVPTYLVSARAESKLTCE